MTKQQIQLLHLLSIRDENQDYVEWKINGISDEMIMELQERDLIFVSIGEGFVATLKQFSLTPAGQDFIKDYCDVCECMPCDCDWGQ